MWVLRAYNIVDDELVFDYELGFVTRSDLERTLGYSPTQLGSNELSEDELDLLLRAFAVDAPTLNGHQFFLDFDADPQEVARDAAPDIAVPA